MNRKRLITGALVLIVFSALLMQFVVGSTQSGEDSDGDHDRLQGRTHLNDYLMNGEYNEDAKHGRGIGASG
jgi:hypothetical protein